MATTGGERRPKFGNSRGVALCCGLGHKKTQDTVSQVHKAVVKRQKWRVRIIVFRAEDDRL